MSAEDSIHLVQEFFAGHGVERMAEDATFWDYTQSRPLQGRGSIAAMLDVFYQTAFSEAAAEIRNVIGSERSVVVEFTFRGVHTGPLDQVPPTGRRVELPMCGVYDVESNQIRQVRLYYDSGTLARQLGLIPVAGSEA